MSEKKSNKKTPENGKSTRPQLVDSHAHITFSDFDSDRDEVVERAKLAGVEFIITIGAGEGIEGNARAVELSKKYECVFATVGVHPHDAEKLPDDYISKLRAFAKEKKVVAIGEIGLDYFRKHAGVEAQKKVFRECLQLAHELALPCVIHSRDAHEDTLEIIKEIGVPKRGGVFHCFSGSAELAKKVCDMGFLISVPGVVTFGGAGQLKEVVALTALEKIIIETDCPFLAPEPYRGKRNEPAYVKLVAEKIAEIKALRFEDVARVTTLNAKRFFELPGSELAPKIAYVIRNSLYLNITNQCNLACRFCPKFTDFEVKGYYLKLMQEPSVDEVFLCAGEPKDYDEVVFCGYGEPTRRLEVLKIIAKRMKERGAKKVRLNTDGLANLHYGRNILPELEGLIDSISISMNAPSADVHKSLCPSKYGEKAYPALLDFVREAKKYIPEVVVSVVSVPDVDISACQKIADELGVPLRVRPFMNVG